MLFSSKRLMFRPLQAQDSVRLLEIYSQSEAMKYRGSAPLNSLEDAQTMLKNVADGYLLGNAFRFGVVQLEEQKLIGTLLLKPKAVSQTCVLGYSLDPAYWGQGYANELIGSTITLLNHSDCHSLSAWVHPANEASVHLLKKHGFSYSKKQSFTYQHYYYLALSPKPT